METLDLHLTKDPERFYEFQNSKVPPVDVYGLAEMLGIVMDTAFTIDRLGFSGEIYFDQGVPKVWINPADPKVRQRFTLAHEIGHYVLHMRGNPNAEGFTDSLQKMRRGGDWDYRETQANRFAAGLLMPKVLIHDAVAKYGASRSALAVLFEVSEESMRIRLETLGYNLL